MAALILLLLWVYVVGVELRVLLILAQVVLVVLDVDLPLILLAEYLYFSDDLLATHHGFNSLMVEEDDPEACGCVSLQLHRGCGVRERLSRQEGEEAGQEVGV